MDLEHRFDKLDPNDKIKILCLMLSSMCMNMRGEASDDGKPPDLRLRQSDMFIEVSHRILEQIAHYMNRDNVQRPDNELFEMLDVMAQRSGKPGLVYSAWRFAESRFTATI